MNAKLFNYTKTSINILEKITGLNIPLLRDCNIYRTLNIKNKDIFIAEVDYDYYEKYEIEFQLLIEDISKKDNLSAAVQRSFFLNSEECLIRIVKRDNIDG